MAAALPLPLSAHLQRNVLAVYAKIVVNVMTVAITHVPSVGLDFVLPQPLHPLPQCSILFLCVSQFIFSIFFCDHRGTNARTLFPGHAYLQSCTLLPLSVVLWSFYVTTAANRLRASRNLTENHALAIVHMPAARQLNGCEIHLWGGAVARGSRLCVRARKSAILCAFYVFPYVLWRACLHLITLVVYTRGINAEATPRCAPLCARPSHSIVLPRFCYNFKNCAPLLLQRLEFCFHC